VILVLVLLVCLAAFVAVRVAKAREARRPRIPVEAARAEVLAVARRGDSGVPVQAVKVLRERTGLGLVEANNTVRRWLDEDLGRA
jgi:ribosomal protein L7/L12